MKKYIIVTLCVITYNNCMEPSKKIALHKKVRKNQYNAEASDLANIAADKE